MRKLILGSLTVLLAACGGNAKLEAIPDDAPFIKVAREDGAAVQKRALARGMSALHGDLDSGDAFYLAINKRELGQRWFLSAFMKQYFPGGAAYFAASSLGTRVVTFKVQNGKLFVFDVDNRKASSDTFAPELIIDAYPIVAEVRDFSGRPNADRYVVFDPAAGLNRFQAVGDLWAWYGERFQVELSFLQRFRPIADGVTFEQVFAGYGENPNSDAPGRGESNQFKGSGTLGVALRRYQEGEGFVPTPMPSVPHFFEAEPRIVPNEGRTEIMAAKWNIKPGMRPIKWLISREVLTIQESFPQYDVIGAIKAGIESWNQAFGFTVVEAAVAEPGDSFADDDKNFVIVDRDPSNPFAFANWRINPNTGEIRGASVYLSNSFLVGYDGRFEDDPPPMPPAPEAGESPIHLVWEPLRQAPLCALRASDVLRQANVPGPRPESKLTKKEKVERALAETVRHEIGHTFGLRHNFKGSLVPPSTSVMDYLLDEESIVSTAPGAYDVAAVKYLYGLSPDLPAQPFCTDQDTLIDPTCRRFDRGADPLAEDVGPYYDFVLGLYLETAHPVALQILDAFVTNDLLDFVRGAPGADVRLAAWQLAVSKLEAPIPADRLAIPGYAERADERAQALFHKLWLAPEEERGALSGDPILDPSVAVPMAGQLQAILENVDGVRSFDARKQAIAVLKKMQVVPALEALLAARATLAPAAQGDVLVQMLVNAIDVAVNDGYFE
jgi:hypothetical protein